MLTKFTENMDIVSALDNEPNDVGGLSPDELKGTFDKGGKTVQNYINQTLLSELTASTAAKNLGAKTQNGESSTVQQEIDALHRASTGAGNVPAGGSSGYVLSKKSDDDFDTEWKSTEHTHPELSVLKGETPPTTETLGAVGQFYLDTATKKLYQCTAIENDTHTWKEISPYNIGDIIYTYDTPTSSNLLYCNGYYINSTDYPELCSKLPNSLFMGGHSFCPSYFSAMRTVYGDGVWAVVNHSSHKIFYTSDNGKTWKETNVPTNYSLSNCNYNLAYGNGFWVTVVDTTNSSGGIWYTTNLAGTWTFKAFTNLSYIKFVNGYFVVADKGGNATFYYFVQPTDTFKAVTTGSQNFYDITYGNGHWVVVNHSSSYNYVSTATELKNDAFSSKPFSVACVCCDYYNDKFYWSAYSSTKVLYYTPAKNISDSSLPISSINTIKGAGYIFTTQLGLIVTTRVTNEYNNIYLIDTSNNVCKITLSSPKDYVLGYGTGAPDGSVGIPIAKENNTVNIIMSFEDERKLPTLQGYIKAL